VNLFAIYLYGSAVDGGLGPESDLDVLVVVSQALTLRNDSNWQKPYYKFRIRLVLHNVHLKSPSYAKSIFFQEVIHSATNYSLGNGYGMS
jgi:predicted nucleotidyltransferase